MPTRLPDPIAARTSILASAFLPITLSRKVSSMRSLGQMFRLAFAALLFLVLPIAAQDNTRFGKPKKDKASPFAKPSLEDHLIDKRPQYTVSYNGKKNTPNWVSWNLRKRDIGDVKRGDNWKQDKTLP